MSLGPNATAPLPTDFTEQGPAVSFDVTPWMTDWQIAKNAKPVNGWTVYGFVLMGIDQLQPQLTPNPPPHKDVCVSTYSPNSVVLEIQYQ